MVRATAFCILAALALSGCADDDVPKAQTDHDPAMSAALEGQLLVDPDLSQHNMRNAAVVPGGPVDPATPPPDPKEPEPKQAEAK
jgi:hypothetical protein